MCVLTSYRPLFRVVGFLVEAYRYSCFFKRLLRYNFAKLLNPFLTFYIIITYLNKWLFINYDYF